MRNSPMSGIDVTLQELIALRPQWLKKPGREKYKWLQLAGQKQVQQRSRGIEFDSTREYQAGDDIRSMAWRVTARSLKPHIKVYREERERPVWLAVDLSPSLYFGTRCMFKSVRSIKHAAYLGWSHFLKHERVGVMLALQDGVQVQKPHTCKPNFLGILHSLAKASAILPAYTNTNYLQQLLVSLQQQVKSGSLIYIISDFFQFDREHEKIIIQLAQRAQVNLTFIYDVFESEPPPPHRYNITDGMKSMTFNMRDLNARLQYQQQFETKRNYLIEFSRKHQIGLHILRTDQTGED